MDMMKLCGAALIAALTALTLRQLKPGFGLVAAMAGGVVIASLLLPPLAEVLAGLSGVARLGGLSYDYMGQMMRVCGVSLLTDFAAQTCRDAGENGLALKVSLGGRVALIGLALPFMQALLEHILSLWP